MKKELPQISAKIEEISHDVMARHLMQLHTFKAFDDTGEILVYNSKIGNYQFNGEATIKRLAENILSKHRIGDQATNHYMKEVIGHIERASYIPRAKFNCSKRFINLKNGRLNLQTMQLYKHSTRFFSTFGIPVKFDSDAECPGIRNFLRQIVQKEDVPLLEEIFGWCLDSRSPIQRAILFIGAGANGKSTFLQLLQSFLGTQNCSAISLQDFSKNRFASSQLYGKLANIHPDLPSTKLTDSSFLKVLTGGDTITAEEKFKGSFEFVNKAKLIFSANAPPIIEDDSMAFWRRMIIVEFPYTFMGNKADLKLLEKLTTPEELSGLLNIAIKGLKRLRIKGDFSYKQVWQQTREKYSYFSDPVTAFVEEDCEFESSSEISKPALYKAYVDFCSGHKIPAGTKQAFGRTLKNKFYGNISKRQNNWMGIKLINLS